MSGAAPGGGLPSRPIKAAAARPRSLARAALPPGPEVRAALREPGQGCGDRTEPGPLVPSLPRLHRVPAGSHWVGGAASPCSQPGLPWREGLWEPGVGTAAVGVPQVRPRLRPFLPPRLLFVCFSSELRRSLNVPGSVSQSPWRAWVSSCGGGHLLPESRGSAGAKVCE